jgi:hypothetical protein
MPTGDALSVFDDLPFFEYLSGRVALQLDGDVFRAALAADGFQQFAVFVVGEGFPGFVVVVDAGDVAVFIALIGAVAAIRAADSLQPTGCVALVAAAYAVEADFFADVAFEVPFNFVRFFPVPADVRSFVDDGGELSFLVVLVGGLPFPLFSGFELAQEGVGVGDFAVLVLGVEDVLVL